MTAELLSHVLLLVERLEGFSCVLIVFLTAVALLALVVIIDFFLLAATGFLAVVFLVVFFAVGMEEKENIKVLAVYSIKKCIFN